MADESQDRETTESPTSWLDYACTPWRASSQRVADLYHSGTKLWTKPDLKDIEEQLENSFQLERFTLRGLNGKQIQVQNPGFRVQQPIWKPYIKFRDYWALVLAQPEGPVDLLYCSYIIDWKNTVDYDFLGIIEDWENLFETRRQLWNASITCKLFKSHLRKLLDEAQHPITKIICLGLGDFTRTFYTVEQSLGKEIPLDFDTSNQMIQHAMALTVAEEVRRCNPEVDLIAQDPGYRDKTAHFLRSKGCEIKGKFGAGAFADVDDESLIIAAYPSAPVRQIIADIAKPAIFITNFRNHRIIMSQRGTPYQDSESPRTMQMWQDYERHAFPTSSVEFELMEGVRNLSIFGRKKTAAHSPTMKYISYGAEAT